MENLVLVFFSIHLFWFSLVNGQNHNVLEFGAKGDGKTDDSEAFVKAWNTTCGAKGATITLLIPAGKTFLLQPIVFNGPCKSTTFKIQLNGVITAPSTKAKWSNLKSEKWISFSSVSGLMIVGSGMINGFGSSFWEQKITASERPTALDFHNCNNLRLTGITSVDSPRNHIGIKNCNTASISNIKLIAPEASPNTDGINIMDSTNINIFDSIIQTGDDCIAISTGSVNINITRIQCGPGHGISVGSLGLNGQEAEVSDVRVTNCTFKKTMNGARIKTWQGGQGYARKISFENITIIGAKNPIIIDQNYIDKGRGNAAGNSAVAISGINFVGFRGTAGNDNAITLRCSATIPCKGIVMDGINITTSDGGKLNVACQNVVGKSSDANLMRNCFEKVGMVY